jgi:hypothetical protein
VVSADSDHRLLSLQTLRVAEMSQLDRYPPTSLTLGFTLIAAPQLVRPVSILLARHLRLLGMNGADAAIRLLHLRPAVLEAVIS